jgi:hypothetical protein
VGGWRAADLRAGDGAADGAAVFFVLKMIESFLLLFFKKEVLSCKKEPKNFHLLWL